MTDFIEGENRFQATPEKQISLTNPDSRSMKSRGAGIVGYVVSAVGSMKMYWTLSKLKLIKSLNEWRQGETPLSIIPPVSG